jgi:hypothetical protein
MPHPVLPRQVRRIGAAIGLVIGAGFSALEASSVLDGSFVPPGWTLAPAIVLAAIAGGWLVAPLAWQARSLLGWVGVVAALSLVTLIVGDFVVVVGWLAIAALGSSGLPPIWDLVVSALTGVIGLFLIGLVVVGWFASIFTTIGAIIWAAAMVIARRWVNGRLAA